MRKFAILMTTPFFLTACGSGAPAPSDTTPFLRAYNGVCDARTAIVHHDVPQARKTFNDQSHTPIHQLAVAVETKSRPIAGRLLEAKQVVEAELAGHATPDTEGFDRLAQAMAAAITAVSDAHPKPCPL